MPVPSARRRRTSFSDEEDIHDFVGLSQLPLISISQASYSRFANGPDASQDSERRRRRAARHPTGEEINRLALDVAGFLMDYDQRYSSPVSRSLLIRHAILPENVQHYHRIMSLAGIHLGYLGASTYVSAANRNRLIFKYDLPAIEFRPHGDSRDTRKPSDAFEETLRVLLLGLILLHDGETLPEAELKSHWITMQLEGYSVPDSKGSEVTLTFDKFIKFSMVDLLYLEKKCVTDEETHVKENWYSWGLRAEATVSRLEALVAMCAVTALDPSSFEYYEEYLREWRDKFAFGRDLSVGDIERMSARDQWFPRPTPLHPDPTDGEGD